MTDQDAPIPGAIPDDAMSSPTTKDPITADPVPQAKADHDYFDDEMKGGGGFSSAASVTTSTTTDKEEDLATKAFRFLATATPETLGGVAVGLGAVTYFVLGPLGLVLIGAFGGIVGYIQWEQHNTEVARALKGEKGVDLVARLLETKTQAEVTQNEQDADKQEAALALRLEDFQPETREAINEIIDAVISGYVKWWYSPLVPSDKFFPLACKRTLTSFILAISNHLKRKRPADAFLDLLTNSSSIVIVFLSELTKAFAEFPADVQVSAADALYTYLGSNPDSNLAQLLNERQQAGKFRMVAEDLLAFLDKPTYECDPARVFLREILAGVVLEMTLQNCCKPEWINSWIVYLLEEGEPDFSQAIDEGMQTGPAAADATFADFDGNVGNIGLTRGNKNSFETEKVRRKSSIAMSHKKKLSKADEEVELMEEMKKLNQMIAEQESKRDKEAKDIMAKSGSVPLQQSVVAEEPDQFGDALKRSSEEHQLAVQPIVARTEPESQGSTSSNVSSSTSNAIKTPLSPLSGKSSPAPGGAQSQPEVPSRFTSFDQIVPPARTETPIEEERPKPPPLTLHNANITILDEPGDRNLGSKPGWDYLVQIEPATSIYPGWMIVRKYPDFERLHEILRRIAAISGATEFNTKHKTLPHWKGATRNSLRDELERYVKDACSYKPLAESEGMKKFLERDTANMPVRPKSGFEAFEKIGKGVFDVMTSAPLEGSKALVDGFTGVLGTIGLGHKKNANSSASGNSASGAPQSALQDVTAASRLSMSTIPRPDSSASLNRIRESIDSQRSSIISTQPSKVDPMDRRTSCDYRTEVESARYGRTSARDSREQSRASSRAPPSLRSPSSLSLTLESLRLPPPPDIMPDNYQNSPVSPSPSSRIHDYSPHHARSLTMPSLPGSHSRNQSRSPGSGAAPLQGFKSYPKLSEDETRVAVELLFAVINELYTLSSAWNFRRTLLAAAKSFLLRPGNPSLSSIQSLIQSSVLDANTSDDGLAAHLRKLRENALPTEEERAQWPGEMSDEEKEKLRVKARKLLIESGVPAALSGVMGQSATGEALGRLFDCLQIEEVARGLMFGVLLQAVKTVTH